jgi:RNA polymerase primary sigma factor
MRDGGEESDALRAYLRGIAKLPRLTPDEERALGTRIQQHADEAALRRLVEGNLRFVVSYVKRYRGLRKTSCEGRSARESFDRT